MGSKPKNTAPRSPVEDPNSLRSRAVGRVIDVLAEGPVEGLVNGLQSVFFDSTPVQNPDGTMNFTGMDITFRYGTPDQTYVPDFPAVESEISVNAEVTKNVPVTRRVDNLSADAIMVKVVTPSLVYQDTKTGDAKGTRVDFMIRLRRAGRTDWENTYPLAIEGKQTGPYERQYRIPLPKGGPWDVQIVRLTDDSEATTLQNKIQFAGYTEIIDHKLSYPNTCYVASKFHAEQFDAVPKREFLIKGWIIKVPDNYDPISRIYNGIWSGNFKMAWTDNPAWIMYALLTHPRGAGLPESSVDRWGLYQIGRYCDEFVDDGYGGREPRYTANGVINTREEAFDVINALASSFRGMAYWSAGAVNCIADVPTDPSVIVTPSNTIGGFSYSGVANKARNTACAVAYLDKTNNYERSIEVYEDIAAIEKYGYRMTQKTGFGVTSRGQALRHAKWVVDTDVNSGDSLSYKASLDHLNVVPGSVIEVHDPAILGYRAGGRINHSLTTLLNIDDTIEIKAGIQYRVKVVMPLLTIEERIVINPPGATSSLQLNQPLSGVPLPGAEWVLLQNNVTTARQFKVLGLTEDDPLTYTVAAIQHDPFKYDRIEKGIVFKAPPFSQIPNPGVVQPPSNVSVERQYISSGTGFVTALELKWDASPDAYVSSYRISYRRNSNNFITLPETSGNNVTIYGETSGQFLFQVQAVNYAGTISRPAILEVNILDSSPITMIRPTGLELEGQGANTIFSGRDPKFQWRATALRGAYPLGQEPAAGAGFLDDIFRDYEIRIYSAAGKLIHTDHTGLTWWTFAYEVNSATAGGPHRQFTIRVYMRDKWGNVSLPAELEVLNPAPPQPVNLSVTAGLGSVFVSHDKPNDTDFAGDLIWLGDTQGFEPSAATVVYDGPSTYNVVQAPQSSVRYLRIASYDVFGKNGLNISPEFRVDIGGVKEPDNVAPKVPTGLRLSYRGTIAPDGTTTYRLKADWDKNTEEDFLLYRIGIAEDGGGFVFFTTPSPPYEWVVEAGARYTVQLAATDNLSNTSLDSFTQSITIVPDNAVKPADPTALRVTGTLRVLWLQWPAHPAKDFEYMEIWESDTNDRSQATHIHNATGTTFPRQGLDSNVTKFYWIKAVTRSLATSDFFPASATAGISGKTGTLDPKDFTEGIINSDFIEDLSAIKIRAGTTISEKVEVNGQALGGIASAALDPAARLNRGVTTIEPGKILISGATTLADWRYGGDTTQINGGNIAANTITANKITLGNRNIRFVGISFTPDAKTNILSWTGGNVLYPDDLTPNVTVGETINPGNFQYTGTITYIVWSRKWGEFRWTTNPQVTSDPNQVVVGIYYGGSGWTPSFGQTIIDGNSIQTGSVHADRLIANTITARNLSVSEKLIANQIQLGPGTINGLVHIENSTIYNGHLVNVGFDKLIGAQLGAEFLQIGGNLKDPASNNLMGKIFVEGRFGYHVIRYIDAAQHTRVSIGQDGPTHVPARDGLNVWDVNGKLILSANGLGVQVADSDQIVGGACSGMNYSQSATVTKICQTGGNIVVQSSGAASTTIPDGVRIRITRNGVLLVQQTFGGASQSNRQTYAIQVIDSPGINTSNNYRCEVNTGGLDWALCDTATIIAIEYKK